MGRNLTKRVWQLHSWLGLGCGLGLVVIGLTGSLLVFHDEIDAWRFPALHRAHPTPAGRLSYDALWQSLRRALPDETVTGWTPAATPGPKPTPSTWPAPARKTRVPCTSIPIRVRCGARRR